MNKFAMLAVSLTMLGTTSGVFAQAKTRAQVYQELIEAKQNGLDYVTDASYPEVATVNQGTVAWLKQQSLAKADRDKKVETGAVASAAQ